MAAKKRGRGRPPKKGVRKPSLYQRVSKQFTALNNKLPEDQKVSYPRRRQIIKQSILPALQGIPGYKIRVKQIKELLNAEMAAIPSRDPNLCNLLYLNPATYALVEWFDLDPFIQKLLPDCVFIKISAGTFGQTNIFNTRNYNYYNSGVKDIVENIREWANDSSGMAVFEGVLKVRPRKKNDGQPDSYYLDMVLLLKTRRQQNFRPQGEIGPSVRYEPQTALERKQIKKAKSKVDDEIFRRANELKKEKDRKSRAYREIRKDKKITSALLKNVLKNDKLDNILAFSEYYEKAMKRIDRALKSGNITPARAEKERAFYNDQLRKYRDSQGLP